MSTAIAHLLALQAPNPLDLPAYREGKGSLLLVP